MTPYHKRKIKKIDGLVWAANMEHYYQGEHRQAGYVITASRAVGTGSTLEKAERDLINKIELSMKRPSILKPRG